MSINKLFIYGSICEGCIHHNVIKNFIVSQQLAVIRGDSYRLEVGYPVLVEGQAKVIGYLVELNKPEIILSILDQFFQVNLQDLKKSLYQRQEVEVQLGTEKVNAYCYFMNKLMLPRSAEYIEDGDWISVLKSNPPVADTITVAEKRYIAQVGNATGRDIVPYSGLTRDLEKRGIVIDKGRRPALTRLGKEILQFIEQ